MQPRIKAQPKASSKPILVLAFFIVSTLLTPNTMLAQRAVTPPAAHETITTLITKDLAGVPGEQSLMYTVDFPPGFSSPVHRHNAQVSVYVLEGSVVMQVRGQKELTLGPGQTFYEDPNDIHVVSRNASNTKPAKFLVFLVHKKDAPLVIPAK
ncbi:cupin domain-containing protein [Granulicella sp. dw_53]|uniref:cupin domain-containing protein n=1 Tax=Granulicella sp. dw_53 TaxID=2719792 RepID=UPI001BD22ED2|nr:cupin domain-containing protein [Granulicella sp. dw_53]